MAGQLDLAMEQGANLSFYFVWSYQAEEDNGYGQPGYAPHDLTGCTARMQIRAGYGTDVLVEATTDDYIEIQRDDELGRIDIDIPGTITDAVAIRKAKADLEVVWPSGTITRVLDIAITNTLNITRDV